MESIKTDYVCKDDIQFPVFKTEYANEYQGLEKTLNKEHGLADLLRKIIKELQKGDKQYPAFISRLQNRYDPVDIKDAVSILLLDGIIRLESKNTSPRKMENWEIKRIKLDPRFKSDFEEKNDATKSENLEETIRKAQELLKGIDSALSSRVSDFILKRKIEDPSGRVICTSENWKCFKSILLALCFAVKFQAEGHHETLRIVSERIWGRSKVLDPYKHDIMNAAGMSLENLNLSLMPEIVMVQGDIDLSIRGKTTSLLAGIPCCLTAESIAEAKILQNNTEKVFLIENLAPFLEVYKRYYMDRPEVAIIFMAGYLSSTKRLLIEKILKSKKVPVYIWSDIDTDGIMLASDAIRYVKFLGCYCSPVLMTKTEIALTQGKYKSARVINPNYDPDPAFSQIQADIARGLAMEQEELFLHFDHLIEYLP